MGYNLKGLFIKEDEQIQKPVEVKAVEPKVESIMPVVNVPIQSSQITSEPTIEASNSNKDIEAKIWETIISKNLPGPDYIEFKNATAGLVDITPDENMQMKGAFNVLKRSYPAFTKEVITASIDTYIGIVNEEQERGLKECNEIRRTKIGNKNETIDNMKKSADEIAKQIEELQAKYADIIQQISTLTNEVAVSMNEIAEQENAFKHSIQSVINTLNADKTKVNNLTF